MSVSLFAKTANAIPLLVCRLKLVRPAIMCVNTYALAPLGTEHGDSGSKYPPCFQLNGAKRIYDAAPQTIAANLHLILTASDKLASPFVESLSP